MFKSGEEIGEVFFFNMLGGSGLFKNKMIVVDFGYGGKDSGMIGYFGKFEKNVMIKIVKLLVGKLRVVGVNVYIIR